MPTKSVYIYVNFFSVLYCVLAPVTYSLYFQIVITIEFLIIFDHSSYLKYLFKYIK
jgi:hypothetical protein